jgi:hypothetical protein
LYLSLAFACLISPYHLLFGREINLPFDISVIPKQHLSSDAKQQLEEILANLKITQDFTNPFV